MSLSDKIRIDKWLWAVRVYKTRSIATDACNSGKVKIGGNSIKPARMIQIGDIITVQKKLIKHKYEVLGLIGKRVSAKIASENVADRTPKKELIKLKAARSHIIAHRERGQGRPTKKERRLIDKTKWENQ
jgi:ribosome-associated heat shock protein Hsp15